VLADGKVGGRILEEGSRFGPPDSMGLVNHLDRAGDTGCDERHRRDPGTSDGEVSVGVGSAGGSVIARWDFFLSPANGTLLTGGDPFPSNSAGGGVGFQKGVLRGIAVALGLNPFKGADHRNSDCPASAGGEARGRRGLGQGAVAMTTRTHFAFRIDLGTPDGSSIVEHVAGVEDFQIAQATYRAAVERWPGGAITLRQGVRVIEDSRRTRFASWADKGRQGGR
jgi:hypothetical protein